jgi:hypothetical protein
MHSIVSGSMPTKRPSKLEAIENNGHVLKTEIVSSSQVVQISLNKMNNKMELLSSSQFDMGMTMRQVVSDSAENYSELTRELSALGHSFAANFSSLETMQGLSADEMRHTIQTAVSNSVSSVGAMGELSGDLKRAILDTLKKQLRIKRKSNLE